MAGCSGMTLRIPLECKSYRRQIWFCIGAMERPISLRCPQMIGSKVLVVVCDEGAGRAGSVGGLVVPGDGGEGEDSLWHTDGDAGSGASAVTFETELVFEGVVDRFDGLAERFEEPFPHPGCCCFGGWSDEVDPRLVEVFFEVGAAVPFVRHDGLPLACCPGVGQHG